MIYILGGGGHAKVVIDVLKLNGFEVCGIIDPNLSMNDSILGVQVIGGDEVMGCLDPSKVRIAIGVGAAAKRRLNRELFQEWSAFGYSIISVIHPLAIIGENVQLAEGCQVMAGSVIQSSTSIGAGSVINTAASIDHDCIIEDHCFIAPSVTVCGGVFIGQGCFVGAGAILLPGVNVGKNSLISAGAVVASDIQEDGYFMQQR